MRRQKLKRKQEKRSASQRRTSVFKKVILSSLLALILFAGVALLALFPANSKHNYQSIARQYADNPLAYQNEIVNELEQIDAPIEELGSYFLPEHPAKFTLSSHEKDVPLLLQTDPAWKDYSYGTDGSRELWENGCAILALAMIDSFYQSQSWSPEEIADWAGDDYYLDGQGSTWSIFPAFAQERSYQVDNLGNSVHQAIESLGNGAVVVVSVKPGYFTHVGHIMVLRGYGDYHFYLNDPNDDPAKMHSIQPIHVDLLEKDALNYWAFCV